MLRYPLLPRSTFLDSLLPTPGILETPLRKGVTVARAVVCMPVCRGSQVASGWWAGPGGGCGCVRNDGAGEFMELLRNFIVLISTSNLSYLFTYLFSFT